MVQLMLLLPIISFFNEIHNGLTFLVPAYQVVLENRPLNGCLVQLKFSHSKVLRYCIKPKLSVKMSPNVINEWAG